MTFKGHFLGHLYPLVRSYLLRDSEHSNRARSCDDFHIQTITYSTPVNHYLGAQDISIQLHCLTLLFVAIEIEWAEENVIPASNGCDVAQREGGHLTLH